MKLNELMIEIIALVAFQFDEMQNLFMEINSGKNPEKTRILGIEIKWILWKMRHFVEHPTKIR